MRSLVTSFRGWVAKEFAKDALAILFCVFIAVTGATGFYIAPSGTVGQALGWLAWVYSLVLVVSGIVGVVAIMKKLQRVELIIFASIAVMSLVHGWIIFGYSPGQADQTAWRVISSGISTLALGFTRWQQGLTKWDIEDHVVAIRHAQSPEEENL